MRIGKPLLVGTTAIGVVGGVYEGYRLAGGLVFLMIAMLSLIGTAIGTLIYTARKERQAQEAQASREHS
jgi:hypothetical protein